METCPVCGNNTLVKEGGCSTCIACGYSKCEDKDISLPSELEMTLKLDNMEE